MWFGIDFAIGIYAALIGGIFAFQRHLMYYPVKTLAAPAVYGLTDVEEVFLKSVDDVKLQVWVHKTRTKYPTIVYFHGNATHLGDRAPKFASFVNAGFGLVAVSYRGFGKSGGEPSEEGIYKDARTAIDYALGRLHIAQNELIYFGESLGTGVAVQMATEKAPGLLVLEAAYTSVETRSAELYPFVIGVRDLVLDKYDSLSKIANVHAPLLMLHGEKDNVIPIAHGRTLFAAANEPKTFVSYPDVYHADYTQEQIGQPLMRFAREHGLVKE